MLTTTTKSILAPLLQLSLLACAASGLAAVAPPSVTTLAPLTAQMSTPVRIAADAAGNIYVTDPRAGGVLKFSSSGRHLLTITTVKAPQGIAATAAGDLVVGHGSAVSVLAADGTLKFRLGAGAGQFRMANGIAIDPSGNIYVVDSLDHCVQAFTPTGTPLPLSAAAAGKPANSFGSQGSGAGQLSQPTGIAYEKGSGRLAVADSRNGRVQFFATDGTPAGSLGSQGLGALRFGSPQGVAFSYEPTGTIMYVVDAFQSNVQAIDLDARALLRVIGSYGTGSGKLVAPTDVAFDSFDPRNSRLMVANGFGNLTLYGMESAPSPGGGVSGDGPALSIGTLPLATNLTSLTLGGSVAAAATLEISVSTTATIGTVTRTGTSWSVPVSGLVPGKNTFTVTATDASGATSSATASVLVTPPAPGTSVTPLGLAALPAVTSQPVQTLSGTVQEGSTVLVNGNPATVTGGSWSYQATLSQGTNTLLVQASNPSFSDATAGINITLDSVPPVLNLSMLPSGSSTSSRLLTVSGSVADSSRTSVRIAVNGTATVVTPVNGTFSAGVLLMPASNSIAVTATDAAGNEAAGSSFAISYTPSAPAIAFTTADGGTVSSGSLAVRGSASPGSIVTVAGQPVAVSGGSWSANLPLAPGQNTIVATATLDGASSSAKLTVLYDPAAPQLAVTGPPRDQVIAGGEARQIAFTGQAGGGVTLSALLDGRSVPVALRSDGSFSIPLTVPAGSFSSHTLVVTAVDAFGSQTSSVRSIVVADPTPPVLTVLSSSPIKVSVGGGSTLTARDSNGPVGTVIVAGETSSLDLTGVAYDAASLNINATTPAGSVSRNGVLLPVSIPGQEWSSGVPGLADAIEGLRLALGARRATVADLLHGDVAPLVNGVPAPDGRIDIEDAMAIMMRIVGLW